MSKKIRFLIPVLLGVSIAAWSQNANVAPQTNGSASKGPIFTPDETTHDYGYIYEDDGDAMHIFTITNTGDEPLIIDHVQSSCGCTEPLWTEEPIEPGKTGDVVITYAAKSRPGPFTKTVTVYTNEKKRRQRLTIKGDVIPRAAMLARLLTDTLGTVASERKDFNFAELADGEKSTITTWLKNTSDEDLAIEISNIPEYISVAAPEKLEGNKMSRLSVTIDNTGINRKGRLLNAMKWKAVSSSGKTFTADIPISANLVQNFKKMTAAEKENSPALKIQEPAEFEFGKVKKSGGFLGIGGNKAVTRTLTVSNTGKSPLELHSVSCDDEILKTAISATTLQPGESATLTVSLRPGDFEGVFISNVIIVSNDYRAPVREIYVRAERAK